MRFRSRRKVVVGRGELGCEHPVGEAVLGLHRRTSTAAAGYGGNPILMEVLEPDECSHPDGA